MPESIFNKVVTPCRLSLEYFETEAVAQRCSLKKMFLKISQNSQENTCPRDSLLIKLQARGSEEETLAYVVQTFKNTYFYRTPLVESHKNIFLLT